MTRAFGGAAVTASLVLALAVGCGGGGDDTGASVASSGAGASTSASSASASSTSATGGSSTATATATASSSSAMFVEADHRAWPQLVKTGDAVMTSPRVVLITASNEEASNVTLYTQLVGDLPSSDWYASWATDAEVGGSPRPSEATVGAALATGTTLGKTTGADYVTATLATADPSLAPDGNTVYLVILPLGATLDYGTSGGVLGHHYTYGNLGDGFAVVQNDPGGNGWIGYVTSIATHEIAEAITDTGDGWKILTPYGTDPTTKSVWDLVEGVGPQGGYLEDGDFCEDTLWLTNNIYDQRIYDNAAAAKGGDPCVPALAVPYFNVSTATDWVKAPKGQPVAIPFNGYSETMVDDFWVYASVAATTDNDLMAWSTSLDTPRTGSLQGATAPIINNGESGTLNVTMPANAKSGDWAVVLFVTWHADASNTTPDGEDAGHLQAVGVYVE